MNLLETFTQRTELLGLLLGDHKLFRGCLELLLEVLVLRKGLLGLLFRPLHLHAKLLHGLATGFQFLRELLVPLLGLAAECDFLFGILKPLRQDLVFIGRFTRPLLENFLGSRLIGNRGVELRLKILEILLP